jgi:hypothetical protein
VKLVVGGNYFNEDGWDFAGKTKIGPLVQDSSMPYGEDDKAVAAFLEYKRFRAQFAYMDLTYDDLGIVPVWAAAGMGTATRDARMMSGSGRSRQRPNIDATYYLRPDCNRPACVSLRQ